MQVATTVVIPEFAEGKYPGPRSCSWNWSPSIPAVAVLGRDDPKGYFPSDTISAPVTT
jgi:hypothetical protein